MGHVPSPELVQSYERRGALEITQEGIGTLVSLAPGLEVSATFKTKREAQPQVNRLRKCCSNMFTADRVS